ncbi:HAMP domain-containing protein [Nonomuraea deserti]|uniref:histidine kinase n=1 Tax=Nonomuraea deserti TaxID=1848322 RepID=A0A4R4V5D8_9ACTN|nr:ATP-binding protein [Nonomuraea deserti]TDC94529.1 HAMP domain-containing protein [Nonomuraea deserti]
MKPFARWTVRLRLTLLYGVLFLGAGAVLLAVTYVLVVHGPPFVKVEPPAAPRLRDVFERPVPVVEPPVQRRAEYLWRFLVASVLALVLMTFAAVGLGWVVAGRVLRPLRTITATVREISARDLHQRLGSQGPDDEIRDLADTFDGLLGRLEAAFEAQRAFVANASHELRTPLTFERSLLEIALADPDAGVRDLRAACERVLTSNQGQERLIEALLTLSRSQRGLDQHEDLDLAEAAQATLGSARAEAAARGVRVEAALAVARTAGDPRLVERLAANLVHNAVRHNVAGGWAHVWTGIDAGRPTLRVRNSGPVIPADQVDALFQPFRRLAGDRTADGHGLGLGLSIVAAVAAAHHAELTARALPGGGLEVRAGFPGDA